MNVQLTKTTKSKLGGRERRQLRRTLERASRAAEDQGASPILQEDRNNLLREVEGSVDVQVEPRGEVGSFQVHKWLHDEGVVGVEDGAEGWSRVGKTNKRRGVPRR